MNRSDRRQHLRLVNAAHQRHERRARGAYDPATLALLASITVEPTVDPADHAFISHLKIARSREMGLPAVAFSTAAVYLLARRTLTGERLGCVGVTIMPPENKALVEDFLVVPGRWGTIAAYAMIRRLAAMKTAKVGFVRVENDRMRAVLEAGGMKITSYIMEG